MEALRRIRVTGKGQLRIKPDMTRVAMTLTGVKKEYAEALELSSAQTGTVKEVLSAFGFAPEDVRTLRFHVNAEYEGYEEQGQWKQRFVGYKFEHALKIEFLSDNHRLGQVLYALGHAEVQPEIQISFTVRDREAAKNQLLDRAVADAREKAAVLAEVAGVALKAIRSIDYSLDEMDFEVRPMNAVLCRKEAAADGAYHIDMEPDDIEVSDTVTMVWEIA